MASTFSDRLGIELIGDGEQSNSWGNTTNNNFGNIFDEAISGFLSIDLSSSELIVPSSAGGKRTLEGSIVG